MKTAPFQSGIFDISFVTQKAAILLYCKRMAVFAFDLPPGFLPMVLAIQGYKSAKRFAEVFKNLNLVLISAKIMI